jgi:UDP-2,3-diacylglucosamine pyrophosphatase LpxH
MTKKKLEVCVLSDLHLGTYGCHAEDICDYLSSIKPEILILNGDIIDIWQFKKRYFPASHMQVLRKILKMAEKGCKVYYITGNHDEALRRYSGIGLGNITLDDKLILEIDGKKTWFFHGDIFDATTQGSAKILAKLGGKGYDMLIWINHQVNRLLELMGKEKMSLSKKVKSGVKKAVSWIANFEDTAAELAIEEGYDVVCCGHIHQPQDRIISNKNGSVRYLNSGDWIENLTSLEYANSEWTIYTHQPMSKREKIQQKQEFKDLIKIPFPGVLPTSPLPAWAAFSDVQ